MLNAMAIQTHNSEWVAQTIIIPAAHRKFERLISDEHPRSQWRAASYGSPYLLPGSWDEHFGYLWSERRDTTYQITCDPIGFQITDDEYRELHKTGELPRNVTLRYQRALETKRAVRIGRRAGAVPAARSWLRDAAGATAIVKLNALVAIFAEWVEAERWGDLNRVTPSEARARKAGPPRNQDNLPAVDLGEAVVKTDPVVKPEPEPVVFVKPEPEPEPEPKGPKPVAVGAKLIRPNGETYIARKIDGDVAGLSDVELYRQSVALGWNILLFGVPGTGKTAALEVAFPGMVSMLGTAETEPADFVGQYVQTAPGKYTWVDGPLVQAMERGTILFVDEIGLVDPRACAVLYSVMDGRNSINVTMNPARGTVTAKPGFGVVAATNPNAPGVRLSEALLSRCNLQLECGTDYSAMRKLGVNDRMVDAAMHMDKLRATGEMSWAPQARELLSFAKMEKAFGLVLAIRGMINMCPELERDLVTAKLRERFGDIPGANRKIRPLDVG